MCLDKWTKLRVLEWLIDKNYPSSSLKPFYINNVDGNALKILDKDTLVNELGINDKEIVESLLLDISHLCADESKDTTIDQARSPSEALSPSETRSPSEALSPSEIRSPAEALSPAEKPLDDSKGSQKGLDDTGTSQLKFKWGEKIAIGSRLDLNIELNFWTNGFVVDINDDAQTIFVHCSLSRPDWDEWVHIHSDRLAPSFSEALTTGNDVLAEAYLIEETAAAQTSESLLDSSDNFASVYSSPEARHQISDKTLFSFYSSCLHNEVQLTPRRVWQRLKIGRRRAELSLEDFFSKYINGEALEPPELMQSGQAEVKTMHKGAIQKRGRAKQRKRSRRTSAMLSEEWASGNRRGLWRCPKCMVVLTAQKRYTHPCFRDNQLSRDQYTQSLPENQNMMGLMESFEDFEN